MRGHARPASTSRDTAKEMVDALSKIPPTQLLLECRGEQFFTAFDKIVERLHGERERQKVHVGEMLGHLDCLFKSMFEASGVKATLQFYTFGSLGYNFWVPGSDVDITCLVAQDDKMRGGTGVWLQVLAEKLKSYFKNLNVGLSPISVIECKETLEFSIEDLPVDLSLLFTSDVKWKRHTCVAECYALRHISWGAKCHNLYDLAQMVAFAAKVYSIGS